MLRLEFSPLVQTDLEAIGDSISQDSPANALRFVEGLRAQCEKITSAPNRLHGQARSFKGT